MYRSHNKQNRTLHPIYQGLDFDDIRYLRILDRCGELGLIVLTHAGRDIGFPLRDHCTPEMTLNALKQVVISAALFCLSFGDALCVCFFAAFRENSAS